MRTKFYVDYLQQGQHNEAIGRMVAAHNSGKVVLTLRDIEGYLTCRKGEFPGLYSKSGSTYINGQGVKDENVLHVTEDGETWTLTIECREIHDLAPLTEEEKADFQNQY
jgi:hypothetical protein